MAQAHSPRSRPRLYALIAWLVLACFLASAWVKVLNDTNSNKGDETANLIIGLDIREGRALTDGNRQPLFPLLLAPFARRSWSYYTAAKLVGILCGLATLVSALFLSKRRWGWEVALLLTVWLSVNGRFADHTPRVLCEALLTGLSFVSFLTAVDALKQPHSWRRSLWAGIWLGLVYLTKGIGIPMMAGYIVAVALVHRRAALGTPIIWGSLVGFLGASSPLLIYNWRRYGQPLYNYNSTHAFWFDSWADSYLSKQPLPTMTSYFATHSLTDIVQRQLGGLWVVAHSFAEAFDIVGLDGIGWLFAAAAVGVAYRGVRRLLMEDRVRTQSSEFILASIYITIFYLFFAWYTAVSSAPRFFLPIVPIVYVFVARKAVALCARLQASVSNRTTHRIPPGAWIALGLAVALWPMYRSLGDWSDMHPLTNPFVNDATANRDTDPVIDWLNHHADEEQDSPITSVLWGPSHTNFPKWQLAPGLAVKVIPDDLTNWTELDHFIRLHDIQAVILDREMFDNRRAILGQYLDASKHHLSLTALPPTWTFAMAQRGEDSAWYVMSLEGATRTNWISVQSRFGEAITLTGYGVSFDRLDQGGIVEVSLAWQTASPLSEDWSVYVHLLDPLGSRVAQSDSYPLGGMYPTSRWQQGESIHDHYVLWFGDDPLAGAYELRVGFYEYQTKARLPVSGGVTDPEGHALILPVGGLVD